MEYFFQIPDAAVKYILYQRTDLLRSAAILPLSKLRRNLPYSYAIIVAMESILFKEDVKNGYARSIEKDFNLLQRYLPSRCRAILDIGCGMGGINILLHRHYNSPSQKFFLLDKTKINRSIQYGFQAMGAFYNSLSVAKELLILNGISKDKVHLLEATEDNRISLSEKIDFAISLASWGFHYPVETYLDEVDRVLNQDGVILLDIRNDTNGLEVAKSRFPVISILDRNQKYFRILAKR